MLTRIFNCFIPGLLLASSALPAVSGIDSVSGRIVGGENAVEGRYTYMVSMFVRANATANFGAGCGGSLIAPDVVLTAAHCFDSAAQAVTLTEVTAPAYDLSQPAPGSMYTVVQAVIHPNYNTMTLANDVALLKLDGTPTNPQLITINQDAAFPMSGQITTDIGWGETTEGGSTADILQVLQSGRYITSEECRDVNDDPNNDFGAFVANDWVCTLTPANEGSCQGDSGKFSFRHCVVPSCFLLCQFDNQSNQHSLFVCFFVCHVHLRQVARWLWPERMPRRTFRLVSSLTESAALPVRRTARV